MILRLRVRKIIKNLNIAKLPTLAALQVVNWMVFYVV